MFTRFRLTPTLFVLSGVLPLTAVAENGTIHLENGVDLTPSVILQYGNNDNLLHAEDSELDTQQSRVSAALLAQFKSGRTEYALEYQSRFGQFQDSSADNYDDHEIQLSIDTVASEYSELEARFFYSRLHEKRGQGLSQGLGATIAEPIEFEDKGAELSWKYSILADKAWLEARVNYLATEFKSDIALANGKDRGNLTSQLGFHWVTGTQSSIFIQGRHTRIDYDDSDNAGPSRDGDDYRALVGVRWQRGELGSGSFGIGYQNKRFDNPLREDFNGLSWEVGVEWNPLERVSFQLDSSRASVEPPLDGDYIKQVLHIGKVGYDFSEFVTLLFNYRYLDQQYIGIDRNEDTSSYGAELWYEFRPNIMVVLSATREDKNSSLDDFSYDQNVIGLEVRLGLK